MHDEQRLANLLGATALALVDLTLGEATKAAGVSSSSAAALVSLAARPGVSVTELGRRVGLTQPAAARMVDSLEADGLVKRRPSSVSSRLMAVQPTPVGVRQAERILHARGGPLTDLLADLDDDRRHLDRLLTNLLTRLYGQIGRAQYICRLCGRKSCTTGAECPVGEAERCDDTGALQERTGHKREGGRPRG
ncbi:MarR family transcriptional regulator [Streptomyces sp. IB201691-2A2]|nr:MarR family transcriptional regulator [Streptomyces sp. IB201691-2A2]